MRSVKDRIRHVIGFEIIGLIILIGVLGQFGFSVGHLTVAAVFVSIIATFWNYYYNIMFDRWMLRYYKTLQKTVLIRIFHACMFELGLLVFSLPGIAYIMNMSLWDAFIFDIGLVVFYLIYAYVYNLAYDKIFPIEDPVLKV